MNIQTILDHMAVTTGNETHSPGSGQRQMPGRQSLQHTEVLDQRHQEDISKTLTIYFHVPCAGKQSCIYSDPHFQCININSFLFSLYTKIYPSIIYLSITYLPVYLNMCLCPMEIVCGIQSCVHKHCIYIVYKS